VPLVDDRVGGTASEPVPAGPGAGSGADLVAARVLGAPARLGPVRLVCVDGPAGSGKTTTAARLAATLRARGSTVAVVHLDDLYDGWRGLEGSLWPRLRSQVLEPLRRGVPGRLQRYDWAAAAFGGWVDVPVTEVLVLEGCGSAQRAADGLASLRVWVAAPDDVRLARGLARDGEDARPHWTAWMADESAHFAREATRERADVLLDGTGRPVAPWRSPDAPPAVGPGLA